MNRNTKYYINPRDEVSIRKALFIGYLLLGVIPFSIILSGMVFSIWLEDKMILTNNQAVLSLLFSFALGWIFWSIFATKWKIWAYSKVKNVNRLKRKAIEDKLIWADGKWFAKTEIATKSQKLKLKELEKRFEKR